MHELSIAAAVVETAERTARRHGATVVEAVRLRIGELSGVVPDALRFSFGLAAEGTAAAGADLLIDDVPALAACDPCGRRFGVGTPPLLWCPGCGRPADRVVAGRELEVVEVRLPAGPPHCPAGGAAAAVTRRGEET